MSDKQCRETCDVYADWLKAGEEITRLEAELAKVRKMAGGNHKACMRLAIENDRIKTELAKYQ